MKKGTKIVLQAEAVQNSYTDREGRKRTVINFIVRNWEFAESKSTSNAEPQDGKVVQMPPKQTAQEWLNIPKGLEDSLPFN